MSTAWVNEGSTYKLTYSGMTVLVEQHNEAGGSHWVFSICAPNTNAALLRSRKYDSAVQCIAAVNSVFNIDAAAVIAMPPPSPPPYMSAAAIADVHELMRGLNNADICKNLPLPVAAYTLANKCGYNLSVKFPYVINRFSGVTKLSQAGIILPDPPYTPSDKNKGVLFGLLWLNSVNWDVPALRLHIINTFNAMTFAAKSIPALYEAAAADFIKNYAGMREATWQNKADTIALQPSVTYSLVAFSVDLPR